MIAILLGGALMMGICIFIHELGHYLAGRLVGVKAEIFSIGYGRGIWKKKIGDTTWQVTAIPFGGYVKFYGDEMTGTDKVPGGLFSVPPLVRIIPVLGGPVFNLILGFLIFFTIHALSGPVAPRVDFFEETMTESPAYRAGLRRGDTIETIGTERVRDFTDIQKHVSLSGGKTLAITVRRGSETLTFNVEPEVGRGGMTFIGIRPPGERSLEVNYPNNLLWTYRLQSLFGGADLPSSLRALPHLHEGDLIRTVQGRPVGSVQELQELLGQYHGQEVEVALKREKFPLFAPWFYDEMTVRVPTQGEYRVELTNVVDLKYGKPVPPQVLVSNRAEHQRALSNMKIDGSSPGSFERLHEVLSAGKDVALVLDGENYTARARSVKIGLFGFYPDARIDTEYLPGHASIGDVFAYALRDTYKNISVYPAFFAQIFSGRMSFLDNAMGPVGMVAFAGLQIKSGLHEYLGMFGAISIALFVMNLLPLPVVDGGHVVFFLYEAVRGKPLSPAVLEGVYRLGLFLLIGLGLVIFYKDILLVGGL